MIHYFERQLEELDYSIHSLDENIFEKWVDEAVKTLEKGHKIIASGLGKNVPICEKFVGSMVSMGLDACFLHTNSAVHGDMGIVKDGDMVILLSKSGETEESVYLARLLRERNISMWLLTFTKESVLVKEVPKSIILELRHEGDLMLLQGLAMQIARKEQLTIARLKANHPGGYIGKILTKQQD